ncbi:IS701 family transposase [Actinoplanes sp. CA-252034]|uniref:IS701 family transposase n=1 Tax=Actinoplanes sp. CA-252034 TaxID=3239906 RepID=UPI003D97F890
MRQENERGHGDFGFRPGARNHYESAAERLCAELFRTLRRRDQREKAHIYVTGLLTTPGRKSVRNIAQSFHGSGAEQSLHHFINDSSWDWMPVRRALVEHARSHRPVRAWVVEPMVVPKTGEHSVGVAPSFFGERGRPQNVQLSFGIWAASEYGSLPVAWWLHVPREWLADDERRLRAVIPTDLRPSTVESGVVDAVRDIVPDDGLPLVLDANRLDALAAARRLTLTGTPFLLLVAPGTPLVVNDPNLLGRLGTLMTAERIAWASHSMRRPVSWSGPGESGAVHISAVADVPVQLPAVPARPAREAGSADGLRLLCIGGARHGRAPHTWLTNLPRHRLPETLYAASLVQRIRLEESGTAERVGIRDYAGRTFTGWHRHATLVSVAHAVMSGHTDRRREQLRVS